MAFAHERLYVYRFAIDYVAWVLKESSRLTGGLRPLRDQWLRASLSIPLNIAEGNGKATKADRRRFFEIARGSVFECAAIQDILFAGKILAEELHEERKQQLDAMGRMLTKLGGRGFQISTEESTNELHEDALAWGRDVDATGQFWENKEDIDADIDMEKDELESKLLSTP